MTDVTPPNLDPEIARILEELNRQGHPRAALGRVLGLDSKQISRLFSGERRLQRHEHKLAMDFLGISTPPASVQGGAVVPLPGLVPLYGWVGAATENRLVFAEQTLRGYVPMHPAQANVRDAFALEVADSSMSPRYEPGELVYLAPNSWPRSGGDCVIVTTEAAGLLKRLVRRDIDVVHLHELYPEPRDFTLETAKIAQVHRVVGRG